MVAEICPRLPSSSAGYGELADLQNRWYREIKYARYVRALSDSIVDLIEVEVFNIGSENPVEELTKHTVCNPNPRTRI